MPFNRVNLLPAVKPAVAVKLIPEIPTLTLVAWTFGRGSVIWRIWPAVLLHTLFAAAVVYSWEILGAFPIPNVMLTVLGVVIGFVISYRAMSGYDRYWMGRAQWSEVIRNSRTMGRLIWYHVPVRLSPKTTDESSSGKTMRSAQELNKAMAEKRMALDLVLAFAVALKHHIRGELGIHYDDLYHLVRPLHDHQHSLKQQQKYNRESAAAVTPRPIPRMTSTSHLPIARTPPPPSTFPGAPEGSALHPSAAVYGTFDPSRTGSRTSLKQQLHRTPSRDSTHSDHEALLPGANPMGETPSVAQDLIPFAGVVSSIRSWFRTKFGKNQEPIIPQYNGGPPTRKWGGPIHPNIKQMKAKAQIGENLPEEILRCLSEWCSVLEDRNTVPGGSLGGIMGGIAAFEANLATLEQILTTPLPFVYSAHISTVWLYLFLLPFQLVNDFGWHTVPAVCVGSFIYLGFLAAGDEIEQPFGYDENDLDLDLFCQDIIAQDIESLKSAPCLNAYLGTADPWRAQLKPRRSMSLIDATQVQDEFEDVSDEEVRNP
ncbi:Bestrophin, RFP-TM, chloride channel-domain-containing protein [Roridomyces roridus]|uniref:Bestrophin, RFP-TM, chloride channel-domain-containing protein n=1 Tax=Roridomyces roridus TaxID=1738132 RepID=A0AAD7FGX6_9AGAR|nr:Bestrophin, RFP-TM, chloride channel-domain-containing protein [Roridomyces roridus]